MPGLYRMICGSQIVESFFDFETDTIGPYKIPVHLNYIPELSQTNKFFMYRLYEIMLADADALAVFNLNNYCIVVVTRTGMYEESYYRLTDKAYSNKLELLSWTFDKPLQIPTYNIVGYIKTYQKSWSVTINPYYLIENSATKELDGFTERLKGNVQLNPDFALYKELITNDRAQAVYFSLDTNKPEFIYQ